MGISNAGGTGSGTYELTSEQAAYLEKVDGFVHDTFHHHSERMDNEEWFPEDTYTTLGSAGYLGITVPKELGGAGLDVLHSGLVLQAFGRWNHALALSYLCHESLCLNTLYRNANEDQAKKYLPGMCAGTTVGALALTEPEAGSDLLGSVETSSRREGGSYLINGTKIFIGNGPVADVILLFTKMETGGGHAAFLVDTTNPGFSVKRSISKMGFRGSPWGELEFKDCRVPEECLVGEENKGHRVLMRGLDIERAVAAPIGLGIAERVLDLCVERAKTRRQFGQAIGKFELVQDKLAKMYVRVETMRTFVYRTLTAASQVNFDEGGKGEIRKLAAASVLYVGEALKEILDEAVQLWGARGYAWEYEINRLYRAVKVLEIGGGTSEIRKIIIAQELMR